MKQVDWRGIAGWLALALSTAITSLWAFWGIIENFHEGWYHESFLANLGLMFVQYLSPMLIFMAASAVAIMWPRVGGGLHVVMALLVGGFFGAFSNTVTIFLLAPLIGLGLLYWFGRPPPRGTALGLAVGLPLLTLTIFAVEPILRVSRRLDDGILGARRVHGNGVELTWAPDGPGWPRAGMDWQAAQRACEHLEEDGLSLAPETRYIWRLPAAEEAVRSMARRGQNSGGVWDAGLAEARYQTTPDKESPLWNVHSQVIYWWTATEVDAERAYMIAYNGKVWPRAKDFGPDYLGFRCVK
jgi:hypothetical protein